MGNILCASARVGTHLSMCATRRCVPLTGWRKKRVDWQTDEFRHTLPYRFIWTWSSTYRWGTGLMVWQFVVTKFQLHMEPNTRKSLYLVSSASIRKVKSQKSQTLFPQPEIFSLRWRIIKTAWIHCPTLVGPWRLKRLLELSPSTPGLLQNVC